MYATTEAGRISSLGVPCDSKEREVDDGYRPELSPLSPPFDPDSPPNKTWFLSRALLQGVESVYLCKDFPLGSLSAHVHGVRIRYDDQHDETLGQYTPGQDEHISFGTQSLIIQSDEAGTVVHVGDIVDPNAAGSEDPVIVGANDVSQITSIVSLHHH